MRHPANDNCTEYCDQNGFVFTNIMSEESRQAAKAWSRSVTNDRLKLRAVHRLAERGD